MSFPLAIFLGVVQGLTEFLPVSSSGHLVLLQKFFGIAEPPIFFDVLLHLGTLAAVVAFFRRELRKVLGVEGVLRKVAIGTLPIVVVGLLVQPLVRGIFGSLPLVSVDYFITTALLLWSRKLEESKKDIEGLSDFEALVVGVFQAVAILPGISRSGSTIVGGLSQGLSRKEAFKFSFYLSLPAIVGAVVLQLKSLPTVNFLPQSFLGMIVAGVVGYFSLKILWRLLLSRHFYLFSVYCFLLGVISLLTNLEF